MIAGVVVAIVLAVAAIFKDRFQALSTRLMGNVGAGRGRAASYAACAQAHGVARRSRLTRRRRESGQSLTETIMALTIVLAIFFGLVHLSLLAVTRHVCNYAAFAGARASMYGGTGDQPRGQAARPRRRRRCWAAARRSSRA